MVFYVPEFALFFFLVKFFSAFSSPVELLALKDINFLILRALPCPLLIIQPVWLDKKTLLANNRALQKDVTDIKITTCKQIHKTSIPAFFLFPPGILGNEKWHEY